MIGRYLKWQRQNRVINLLLVIGYVVFLVFAHEWFVDLSVDVMNSLSLTVYNRLVAVITGLGLFAVLGSVLLAVRSKANVQHSGILFVMAVLATLVVHFFVYTEMNIEFIHAMEFGLLAVLIYPLVGRYGAAIIYSFPVMLFDEWYQYQVLFDWVEYFDFNDILLDLLGAGLFLAVLKTFNSKTQNPAPIAKRPEVYLLLFMVVTTMVLLLSSVVVSYQEEAASNTWLILNTIQEPYGFWREHPLIGSSYHVLEPIAGLVTVFSVCLIYLTMDPMSSEK